MDIHLPPLPAKEGLSDPKGHCLSASNNYLFITIRVKVKSDGHRGEIDDVGLFVVKVYTTRSRAFGA